MIRASQVLVIDEHGKKLGVLGTDTALKIAAERSIDLVEVSPQTRPPVCKLLDYGKFRFNQDKKKKESRKHQKSLKLKEVRMQPKIDTHDLTFKTKYIRSFLDEGNKVKVSVRFRGREFAHTNLGKVVLEKILLLLESGYRVDKKPTLEGRMMSMILSHTPKKPKKEKESNAKDKNT